MTSARDELDAWWSEWWATDYSWEALANKVPANSGPHRPRQTLQDYWRDQESNLVTGPDGRRWTRFHLPLMWPDGADTGKMALIGDRTFQQEVAHRFENAATTVALDGCVLPHFLLRNKHDVKLSAVQCFCVEGLMFSNVEFVQRVDFSRAWFDRGASFPSCQFADGVYFVRSKFKGGAHFKACVFEKEAEFGEVVFDSTAWFGQSHFKTRAAFNRCHFKENGAFNGARFDGSAHFGGAVFDLNAQFFDVQFLGGCVFRGCTFQRSDFSRARFEASAAFDLSTWAKSSHFSKANFSAATRITFESCDFEATVYFDSIEWPRSAKAFGGAFRDTVFKRIARFTGPSFNAFALFEGAAFEVDFQFSLDDIGDDAFYRAAQAGMIAAAEDFAELSDFPIARLRDARLVQLENSMRALRYASDSVKDHTGSQAFYRFELMCRQRQSFLPTMELFCLDAYGLCSDYGRSILRPLLWLLLIWLAFTISFWMWGVGLDQNTASVGIESFNGAARLSVRSIMVPFSGWNERLALTAWERMFLTSHGSAHETWARVVSSFESLLAVVLLFLSGLAVRRRFQLS